MSKAEIKQLSKNTNSYSLTPNVIDPQNTAMGYFYWGKRRGGGECFSLNKYLSAVVVGQFVEQVFDAFTESGELRNDQVVLKDLGKQRNVP